MMFPLSSNAQAILLLTAPLIVGGGSTNPDLLSPGEYKRFAQRLRDLGREPADLILANPLSILADCKATIDPDRVQRLLGRGFQLSQAVGRWETRAIWVISRADPEYPPRLKARLRADAPAVLYGCGEASLLDRGGLAVVGSRHVDDALVDYTIAVGDLVARAKRPVISGGAKGIDQAAMRGALEGGGQVCGVLADSLEKQAMNREHRNNVLSGQLTLISPYDPNAGFNVGNAMQRNKLIYALADAALVVSSDVKKGGTWSGAAEQLDKFKLVPVYVRSTGTPSLGLEALRKKGAAAWPNPESTDALGDILDTAVVVPAPGGLGLFAGKSDVTSSSASALPEKSASSLPASNSVGEDSTCASGLSTIENAFEVPTSPAATLLAEVRKLIEQLASSPAKDSEIAEALDVTPLQARLWLMKLLDEGVLEKKGKPSRYVVRDRGLF